MRNKVGTVSKGMGRRCSDFRQLHEEHIKKEGIVNTIPTQLKRFMSTNTKNKNKNGDV